MISKQDNRLESYNFLPSLDYMSDESISVSSCTVLHSRFPALQGITRKRQKKVRGILDVIFDYFYIFIILLHLRFPLPIFVVSRKGILINKCSTLSLSYDLQNMHQGYPTETLVRFLKARDWNVAKAHKMVRSIYLQRRM